jgi:hypothetical protein
MQAVPGDHDERPHRAGDPFYRAGGLRGTGHFRGKHLIRNEAKTSCGQFPREDIEPRAHETDLERGRRPRCRRVASAEQSLA